jgi:hypothetical protein
MGHPSILIPINEIVYPIKKRSHHQNNLSIKRDLYYNFISLKQRVAETGLAARERPPQPRYLSNSFQGV